MYNNNRIIAVGDLHGDYKIFIKILEMTQLIDSNGNWVGKDTYVVQVGDTLDGKRPDVTPDKEFLDESGEIELMRYIIQLDSQAKRFGGRVISLLGNHELYPYYLKDDPDFLNDYVKTKDIQALKEKFNGADRLKFFQPGKEGANLLSRTRPLLIQLGEFLFIHGSITNRLIKFGLDSNGKVNISKINEQTSKWLNGKGKIPKYLEDTTSENPVFSRMYSSEQDFNKSECDKISKQLSYFNNVNYVVMGHSRYKNINATCQNKLIRTDVSLSRAFGGKLSEKVKNIQVLQIEQYKNKDPSLKIITPTKIIDL